MTLKTLAICASLLTLGGIIAQPAFAHEDHKTVKGAKAEKCGCGKPKGSCADCKQHLKTPKASKTSKTKTVAAKMYECQHCRVPMTGAKAKAQGMQCCGMKMVEVKTAKKTDAKKKG